MTYSGEAVYENGVLKLDKPMSLEEGQRVRVIVKTEPSRASQTSGLIGWKGDAKTLEWIAQSPDLDEPDPS